MWGEKWFPHIAAVITLSFSIIGFAQGDYITGSVLMAVIVGLYSYFISESLRGRSFLAFLEKNRGQLMDGKAVCYKGTEINATTETTRFQACVSFIVPWPWGAKLLSSFYIKRGTGRQRVALVSSAIACSIITVLFGALGVWTIVWLFSTLAVNIRGGHKLTVSEVLAEFDRAKREIEQANWVK